MEKITSYAEENEDIILYHMLKGVKEVKYIDIGVENSAAFSATKFFSVRGGSGINIEADRNYIQQLKKDRPGDINLAVMLSDISGTLKRKEGGYDIPVVTLRDICNKYISDNQETHFMKISVAGEQKKCIEGANLKKFRPWIICIKTIEPAIDATCGQEWERILFENNYCYAGMHGANKYYVAQEHKELVPRFLNTEEMEKKYSISHGENNNKREYHPFNKNSIQRLLSHPFFIMKIIKAKLEKNSVWKGSANYWEERYKSGGTSGAGSYNRLAEFKAKVINDFVNKNCVQFVIEWGCGDGNQLSLMDYPKYVGYDVSREAIKICRKKFIADHTKTFEWSGGNEFSNDLRAELALSLDVIFHLIEDETFESYMKNLFASSERYVIIYSSNFDAHTCNHVRSRCFTDWIENNLPMIGNWRLIDTIKNEYPYDSNNAENTSFSDFYIYEKYKG